MQIIRKVLGALLVLLDRLLPARAEIVRSSAERAVIAERLRPYALYQFTGCPFCIKVRRYLRRRDLAFAVELRNCEAGAYRDELAREGGEIQVPCLKIPGADGERPRWLYESDAIIAYFDEFTRAAV